MHAIRATWTNGRIVPAEPVDWPEGSQLLVEPLPSADKIGMDESEWRDDPESIAAWIAAVEKIQPWRHSRARDQASKEWRTHRHLRGGAWGTVERRRMQFQPAAKSVLAAPGP